MSAEDVQQIGKDEAAAALRRAAFTTDPGYGDIRQIVHSFAGAPGIAIGADHDLDDALGRLEQATEVAWVDHPLGHDLAVFVDGRAYFYDVRRPGSASA